MADMDYSALELVTTVDLGYKGKDTNKPVYHFIYGSQLYETVFAIYCNFKIKPSPAGDSCEVQSISFKILNYKGLLNIGFAQDPIVYEEVVTTDGGEKHINFKVQGASTTLDKDFIFPKPLVITKGIRERILFNRNLIPLPSSLYNPGPEPINSDPTVPRGSQPPQSILFDTEFHHRDGVDYYNNIRREGMDGWNPPVQRHIYFASIRCLQSNVNLLF